LPKREVLNRDLLLWRGNLALAGFAPRHKLSRGHHKAMPYQDVPAFVVKLREMDSVAAMALEFTILTAARSGEAREATWKEIDLDTRV
jgi:integrase